MMTDGGGMVMNDTATDFDVSAHTSGRMSARSRRIEVFTGPERRRRWSLEQKRAIVAESFRDGVSPAAVARRHDLNTAQLHTWRRQLAALSAPVFARVALTRETPGPRSSARPGGMIEVVLPDGILVRTDGRVDGDALRRVLGILRG